MQRFIIIDNVCNYNSIYVLKMLIFCISLLDLKVAMCVCMYQNAISLMSYNVAQDNQH